jgi:hypothetical protein
MVPHGRSTREHRAGVGESFHRIDGEGEWVIRFDGEDVTVTHEHAKADVAVRGTYSSSLRTMLSTYQSQNRS